MSGAPTEAEIQSQWRAAVDILEVTRDFLDGTLALTTGTGKFDVLVKALEGQYTPDLAAVTERFRATCSTLIDSSRMQEFLLPILFEYGPIIDATSAAGGGFSDPQALLTALYEHFVVNSLTVESRAITFDTTATTGQAGVAGGGTIVGNGSMSRLTLDENGFDLEACHVETKRFRCIRDQNSGVKEQAEEFLCIGEPQPKDALLISDYGSGQAAARTLRSLHAGSGPGGSILRNSSFSTHSETATPEFSGWTETAVGGGITIDTTNTYRGSPGVTTAGALQMTGGGGIITLKQVLADMRRSQLDPNTPYFLRAMLNKTVGTASGGSVNLRLGSQTVTVTIAAMAANWTELLVPLDQNSWLRNFNEDPFDVEIEWESSSSGTLLVDDMIFAPMTLIDGTWWALRATNTSHIPWLLHDYLEFTDTGGAAATAKMQYYLWRAFGRYLPSTTGTPTVTEP